MIKAILGMTALLTMCCASAPNRPISNEQTENVNSKFSTTNTVTVSAPEIPESQISNSSTTPNARTFIDGSQIVGKDIQPGMYRTRAGTPNCAWSRRSGFTGEPGEIVAAATPRGPAVVTVKATDKGFDSTGCGMWTSDLSRITTSLTAPFGDGEYQVGVDISPGTWKAENTAGCYWARLKGFSGEPSDMITNSNDSGIVKILKGDKGFSTSGCGSWSKVE
jgi:hypothetical protein